jgi:hypothetical protein
MDCIGPLPFKHSFFKVFLDGRKGWQHKQGYDGTRESEFDHEVVITANSLF